jgi:hypothetical protein
MSEMTSKMSECGSGQTRTDAHHERPRKGEHYRCPKCGVGVQINSECRCQDPAWFTSSAAGRSCRTRRVTGPCPSGSHSHSGARP